jgi:hypothetical protein
VLPRYFYDISIWLSRKTQGMRFETMELQYEDRAGENPSRRVAAANAFLLPVTDHYLFADKFGHPAKGKVEGLVGYARRNAWFCSLETDPLSLKFNFRNRRFGE